MTEMPTGDATTTQEKHMPHKTFRTVVCLALMAGAVLGARTGALGASRAGDDTGNTHKETTMATITDIFPRGGANTAYAKYFVGNSYLNMLSTEGVVIGNVTFEPGCRNNWHIHHAAKGGGQILLCTAGRGWFQEWGKAARELRPGDVVHIPAGVKHWHGAAKDSWFAHLAVETPGEATRNEWLEPVSEEQYTALP